MRDKVKIAVYSQKIFISKVILEFKPMKLINIDITEYLQYTNTGQVEYYELYSI